MKRVRMAALISGGGSNLQAILDAIGDGRIHGDMVLVISDQRDVYGLERARKMCIRDSSLGGSQIS